MMWGGWEGSEYKKQVSEKIHFMYKNVICFTYNLFLILSIANALILNNASLTTNCRIPHRW